MTKKVIGDLAVSENVIIDGDNAVRSVNGVTASQTGNINIPLYSREYIDKMISMFPITRVGSMDYLPLNISGSFEGATTRAGLVMPNIVENDGTFVYLRPGTNGSSEGWYYSFIKDIRSSETLDVISTNSKYKPGTITSKIISFVGCKGSEALMMKANNGSNDTYIIGITNGTFDYVSHQYVEVNASIFGNTNPQYVHLVGSKLYIWCLDFISDTLPVTVSLFTINASDIRNGVSTSLAKSTGFTGRNIYNDVLGASPNIQLSQSLQSTNINDKPLFLIGNGVSFVSSFLNDSNAYIVAQPNSDLTKIRVALYTGFRTVTPTVPTNSISMGISFEVNISNLSFTHDFPLGNPISVYISNGTLIQDNPFSVDTLNISGAVDSSQGKYANIYQTSDGITVSTIARYVSGPEHTVCKSNVSGFTNPYDSWNLKTRAMNNKKQKYILPFFGSALGENLIHPRVCDTDKLIMACSSTKNGITYGYDSLSYTKFTGSPNYVYNSISGVDKVGFAPNINRDVLDNSNNAFTSPITIVDQNGSVRMYGSSFVEGFETKLSGGLLDPDTMTFSGSYTLSNNSVLGNIKNKIITASGFSNVVESKVILYYVPESTYSKSFGVCIVRLASPHQGYNAWRILCEVDVVISSNVISDANIVSTRNEAVTSDAYILSNYGLARQGGLTIAKYSDFTFLSIYSGFAPQNQYNLIFTTTIGKIDNSSKLISTTKILESNYLSHFQGSYGTGVIPNMGFGLFKHGEVTDDQTKMIFRNYGTTSAQMDVLLNNLEATPVSEIVIASQDVPEGFIVYFTQEIPVLLSGKYFKLDPRVINLQDLFSDVLNKTLYIYVSLINGEPQYQISDSLLTEELYRVYIGYITTDDSSITNIVSDKVTRFLTYRVSTTKRGSAIPCSTGVPSSTGTRWH